jgi:hypothetical protein
VGGRNLGPGNSAVNRNRHLDDGRLVRDERWLLEIGAAGRGERFFDCGTNRDGAGYRDVTDSSDPEVKAARARCAEILAGIPEPKADPEVPSVPKTKAEKKAKRQAKKAKSDS